MCVCVCAECCDENVNYPENATYTFTGTTRRTTAATVAIEGQLHISEGEGEDCGLWGGVAAVTNGCRCQLKCKKMAA